MKVVSYADDNFCSSESTNVKLTIKSLEMDASNMSRFIASNKLLINTKKTKIIIFNKKVTEVLKISIGGVEIQENNK